jgi:hypothetical protein
MSVWSGGWCVAVWNRSALSGDEVGLELMGTS